MGDGGTGILELNWVGKHDARRPVEPRILVEDRARSYRRPSTDSQFDNWLIQGDNLLALRALEEQFGGQVKCIFIDPPYNTGSAFTQFDDGKEHSTWLSFMRARLEIMKRLLARDGSIWITIDDNEAHYLKVLCDEIFGRKNFVANVMWEKKFSPQNDARQLSVNHDHILVVGKSSEDWQPNLLPRSAKQEKNFKNPDDDPRGPWISGDYTCAKSREERPNLYYPIRNPVTNQDVWPKPSRVWAYDRASHDLHVAEGRLWWGTSGRNPVPRLKKFPDGIKGGTVPSTVWLNSDVGNNQEAKRESIALFGAEQAFATPKPERLLQRILTLATNPGDLVLDSFAGSGTTGAVAHKMGRRWIMVEIGDHAHTHIVPRLRRVIDGKDTGGVTAATGWSGGGGFRFFTLGATLVTKDRYGRPVLNRALNDTQVRAAVCRLFSYTFAPSDSIYWQHGQSTESDFIYVVPRTLTRPELDALSEDVGESRTLLVVCKAWFGRAGMWPNLTLKRMPRQIESACEFGRDDYSLEIDRIIVGEPSRAAVDLAERHMAGTRAHRPAAE